jgi:Ca-activated chloride channel family protein
MKLWFPVIVAGLLCAASAHANGLLIPTDGSIPPLALVRHEVKTTLIEQVAQTEVTQVFRNHTDRALEATFVFPVPAGASVSRFSMWIDGKEVKGEMVEADKAKQIYTDIVKRMQDPGLLEYIGQNLLRVRVYPVPANGEQKLALRFTSVCTNDAGLVEYCYPLKTAEKAAQTLEKFSIDTTIESQRKVHNVYSPTHAVTVTPVGDHKTKVHFEAKKATLDRDLKLYYSLGTKDVGLTALSYRNDAHKDGSFLLLISPRAELSKTQHVSRDMVFVLDTSGSMAGPKMDQARKALKHCLGSLHAHDRFAVMNFATTVVHQNDTLQDASKENIAAAKKWVDELEATGGTAIDDALSEAIAMRGSNKGRPFTVVFFTDGQPTVGEQDPEKIINHVSEKNNSGTRIFTFGVGDDVNASLLDRLAEMTRSASTYVRPEEDIEIKASNLFAKISHPVMTELKVSASAGITLSQCYPKQLPDLFHGGQIIVCGKYKGHGHSALTLTGKVDGELKEMVYDIDFPAKTGEDRAFVEGLWARRKVGYLLDEIRNNGQQKELIDEIVKLAKKHGITTPYSSYLVVPDTVATNTPVPTTIPPTSAPGYDLGNVEWHQSSTPLGSNGAAVRGFKDVPSNITNVTNSAVITNTTGTVPAPRATTYAPVFATPSPTPIPPRAPAAPPANILRIFERSAAPTAAPNTAPTMEAPLPQAGKEGVELALVLDALRNEEQLKECKTVQACGKSCREIGGAWVDEAYKPDMKIVRVKAMSDAFFKLLAKHPEMKDVFRLGNRIIWVTPNGSALVIDSAQGSAKMTDKEIDALFTKK